MTDVSRETSAQLAVYAELIKRWNPRINLVSRQDVDRLADRHFADAIAVASEMPDARTWADLGSGGGLPGLVVAILRQDEPIALTLVESDQRKATFLRTVARMLDLHVMVRSDRIEDLPPLDVEVVSARALAPLPRLLALAVPHLTKGGTMLFPKGVSWRAEVEQALETWRFDYDTTPSPSQEGSVILKVRDAHPRER